jgi:predicted acylesterase/phospholipase RssA
VIIHQNSGYTDNKYGKKSIHSRTQLQCRSRIFYVINLTMKTISLVLGSGGARGLAHIGVIRYLESNGYEIKSISGSSAGALIGGVYAAGKLDEFEEWVKAITKLDMVRLLDISWSAEGFSGETSLSTPWSN